MYLSVARGLCDRGLAVLYMSVYLCVARGLCDLRLTVLHMSAYLCVARGLCDRRLAVLHILMLEEHGCLWMAPVCSSWVFMSRGSTERSPACPLGVGLAAARGNTMMSRAVLLARLAHARRVSWYVEQPQTSLMPRHPRWQELFNHDQSGQRVGRWLNHDGRS